MNHYNKKGFTLIELMLAMTFISVLLIAIVMTVIQISNIYNRGLTIKEVNQAGRSLTSDLQRSVSLSSAFPVTGTDSKFIQKDWGGRLCLGQYSYIWNYGATLKDPGADAANSNVYKSSSTDKIRFIKVPDSTGQYCKDPTNSLIEPAGAVELLQVGDLDLAMHKFTITNDSGASDSKTKQGLYYISFVIGTNDQSAINPSSTTCLPPSDKASDLNYCSVNQFDIVARTGNALQ
jgi:type II secretory pathway pseudopilin PulG